ncbi:MAG: hypothetical protein AAGC96_04585 [Pseudomonadota bacterium]
MHGLAENVNDGCRRFIGRIGATLAQSTIAVASTAMAMLVIAGVQTAGAQAQNPKPSFEVAQFPECCPRPAWWNAVESPTRIDSMQSFNSVWQDRSLSKKQKAKALFQAIEDHANRDDDITAAAVNYFYWVGNDYAHIRGLYEFGVGRYLDYNRPLKNYGGKSGDMSAGMINNLSKIYMRDGDPEKAVPWLTFILNEREADVNDHLLETAAAHLATALTRLDRKAEAVDVLLAARRNYDGDWEKRLNEQLDDLRSEMGLSYYVQDTWLALQLLGIAILIALATLMLLQRRRSHRWGRET